jgi:Domain of unknown function (DUF1707)/Cell wall-active antibiotics response 4TMS YvqF
MAAVTAASQVGVAVPAAAAAGSTVRQVSEWPELRVSDADRETAVARLRVAGGEGRLTFEELAERVELADAARTRGELEAVTADLPHANRAPAEQRPRGWIIAVMGGAARKGRWRPPRRTNVITLMGGAELDLREAELAGDVTITAVTVMGGIGITVPEGVSVELSGFALMGANGAPHDKLPPPPGAPVVRVRAFALMGGVGIERRKPRRPR